MSGKIGSIIDETGATPIRESSDPKDAGRNSGDTPGIGEPEVIDFGYDPIEPTTARIQFDAATGQPKRTKSGRIDGRTRAGRTGRTETAPESKQDIKDSKISLEALLLSLHQMGAAFLKVEELALDPAEAKQLADGIAEVGKYYAMSFDPKKVAIANLIIVAGGIYGTRVVAYRMRKTNESRNKLVAIDGGTAPAEPTAKVHVNGAPAPTGRPVNRSPSEVWYEPAVD